jgi:hypothetical protein
MYTYTASHSVAIAHMIVGIQDCESTAQADTSHTTAIAAVMRSYNDFFVFAIVYTPFSYDVMQYPVERFVPDDNPFH